MKKKTVIIIGVISAFVLLICIIGFFVYINYFKKESILNDENVEIEYQEDSNAKTEELIDIDELNDNTNKEDVVNNEDLSKNESNVEKNTTQETKKETSANSNNANKQTSSAKTNSNTNTSSSAKATTKSTTNNNNSTKESTNNEKQTTQTTTSNSKEKSNTTQTAAYWCDEGGTHHIGGDGPNEHGYYNTWNDAYNAFLQYTKDWESGNYEIGECQLCGKYYFKATKN